MPAIFELGIVIISIVGITFLGMFTYNKNSKSATNVLFFLFSSSLSIYNVINYLALHQYTDALTIFWIRMVMANAAFIVLLFFLLTAAFPQKKLSINNLFLWFIILTTIGVALLALTNLIFYAVVHGTTQPIPGIGIIFFLIHDLFCIIGGFVILFHKYKTTRAKEKTQVGLFLIGTILLFISILTTNLFFVILLHTTALVGLLPLYTLIFVGVISYAIVRHKFLDIGLIVARSVAYTLILLVIGGVYTFYFFFIGGIIFHIPFSSVQFMFYGFAIFIIAFTFQPMRRALENITDKFLYKGFYNSQDLLKSLSDIMALTIDLKKLTADILSKVTKDMRITRGAFVLLRKKDHRDIDYIESQGYMSQPDFKKEDIDLFLKENQTVLFDDLEEGQMKETMRKFNASAALSLMVHEEKIGMLFLGEKSSGDIYSQKDVDVLSILAPQLSVAIQNSEEFEEIKRFNITLREGIDKATKELQHANEKLKQMDALKDEFVSLASHELRTPMTAIKSYLWLVLQQKNDVGSLNDKQKLYLDRTYQSTQRLIDLVNDMLNVSRIEAGRLIVNPVPTDMIKLSQDVLTEVMPKAQEQKISVTVATPSSIIPHVSADPAKIKEVLINLIGNSLKFTPAGGKILVSFTEKDGMVITSVTDTGRGIKQEDMGKLFQKFEMLGDGLPKQSVPGTGLGLYISKSIVKLHGGDMWVASEGAGKGATFSFSLKKIEEQVTTVTQPNNVLSPSSSPRASTGS